MDMYWESLSGDFELVVVTDGRAGRAWGLAAGWTEDIWTNAPPSDSRTSYRSPKVVPGQLPFSSIW
jgi:hypothetical protein